MSSEPAAAAPVKRRWWPFGSRQTQQQPTTSVEMLKTALEVRKQTVTVIQQIERDVALTNEAAQDVAQQLQRDKERIQQMSRSQSKAAPNVQAAVAHGRSLFRGLARDKFFIVLLVAVVVLAIVVIVLSGIFPLGLGQSANAAPATTAAPNTTRAPNVTRPPLVTAPPNATNTTFNGTMGNSSSHRLRWQYLADGNSPWFWAVFG